MTHSKLTTWLWRHLSQFFLNNAFIVNSGLLKFKIWIGQLVGLLRNSRIHIELHSKLFIGTKHGFKNEIIKLSVKSFFVKP
jgi:hypothetical protein